MLKGLHSWLLGAALMAPGLILAASGIVHLRNGRALEAAFPAPFALSLNNLLPKAAYIDAADALRQSDRYDGTAQIWLAEARFHAGAKPQDLLNQVQTGLSHAPASAEGWAFYSEMLEQSDPKKAAMALDQSLTLAPYDYFWAGTRAQLASSLWNYLNINTKAAALQQIRMLWETPALRDGILQLTTTAEGRNLLMRAYTGEPEAVRAINRWVFARLRQIQLEKS